MAKPHRLTGNKLYKLRSKHGRDKIFSDPCLLLEEAFLYFDWCDRHPWERNELVKYKGDSEQVGVSLGRPYSIEGLTCYLGVSASYFRSAKANINKKIDEGRPTEEEQELLHSFEFLEQIIRTQNIEGATVGVFSPHIVTRIFNLAETINNNGAQSVQISVRDDETAKHLRELGDLL